MSAATKKHQTEPQSGKLMPALPPEVILLESPKHKHQLMRTASAARGTVSPGAATGFNKGIKK